MRLCGTWKKKRKRKKRGRNIKERQEAMKKRNFFKELKRKILEGNKETDKPGSSKSDLKDNQIYFEVDDKKYTGSSKEDPVEKGDDTEIYDYMFIFDAE